MTKTNTEESAGVSPVGDCARIEFYDSRGEPYFTEWQPVGPGDRLRGNGLKGAGLVAAVAGIRPKGCGEATARAFASRGYRVLTCDRDPAGRASADALRVAGGDVRFVEANVATPEGVEHFMAEIARVAGRLDVLVCNAGNAGDPARDNILDITPNAVWALLDDNLVSPILLTARAVNQFMVPQGSGSVIYLGTNNGQRGMGVRGQLVYGAAKTALSAVVAACTAQLGRTVRFNLVRPGVVETDSENWRRRKRENPQCVGIEAESVPAGELARPDDVANAIVWLASDESRYVRGVELAVDGGEGATGVMCPAWDPTNFRTSYVASVGRLGPVETRKAA
jgi:NAD(P)-dependent dehydrogenase (short-subunit alcohol dehydrogenase family)